MPCMKTYTGGCLCGDVRVVAVGEPDRVGICHCMDCRKHHGALFHASAIFDEGAVTIEGEVRGYRGRFFCPTCGSCSGMFTANSMNCLTEALGLSLPGNGSTLATHADRQRLFEEAGQRIVGLARVVAPAYPVQALPRRHDHPTTLGRPSGSGNPGPSDALQRVQFH